MSNVTATALPLNRDHTRALPHAWLQVARTTLNGVLPMNTWGVIRAQGMDAVSFLQGQLTQDVALLPVNGARLAAWCSAKGRMLASFIVVKAAEDDIWLLTPQSTLATTLKRLTMFVLRAKVKLSDASSDFSLYGVAGDAAMAKNAIKMIAFFAPDGSAPNTWPTQQIQGAHVVTLPPAGDVPCVLWVAPVGGAAPQGDALTSNAWGVGRALANVAVINMETADQFVPQMLNYESVGGVNFKKGCYPGQEVVARSQFRGTLKRRAFVMACDSAVAAAGQEVFHSSDAEQPCGLVAQAAADGQGGSFLIASLQLSAMQANGHFTLGAADGTPLSAPVLPYPLLADV